MKILIRIILSIVTIVIVMLLIMAIFLINAQNAGNTPYFLNYTGFVNTGTSMLPVIREGDFILVKKQDNYQKDDIISYKADDLTVTHRIVEVEGAFYRTKGDNNTFIDGESVSKLSVYGKVVATLPGVGSAIIYLMEHKGLVIGLLLGLVILAISAGIGMSYVRKCHS